MTKKEFIELMKDMNDDYEIIAHQIGEPTNGIIGVAEHSELNKIEIVLKEDEY